MNFFIKISLILFIISSSKCKGCLRSYPNNIEKADVSELSSWIVKIFSNSEEKETGLEEHYGALIHPQAVYSLDLPLIILDEEYYCIGGCPPILDRYFPFEFCQRRNVLKVYRNKSNAIVILKNPFFINPLMNVIKLAKTDEEFEANCYFYAMAFNSIENDPIDNPFKLTMAALYKVKLTNGFTEIYQNSSKFLTNVIDRHLSVKNSSIAVEKYRSSPVICPRKSKQDYAQVGFMNLDFATEANNTFIKSMDFINNVIRVRESIYQKLIDHFQLTSIVGSIYNEQ